MASMLGLIGAVRRKCGFYAPSDGPDEGIVAEFILEVLDEATTELGLATPTWYLPRFSITAQVGVDETQISQVGDFGRAYMVLTAPSTAGPYDTRVVEMVDSSVLYRLYGAGDRSQTTSGSSNTIWASACAFSFHDGSHWFQVGPVPSSSADYTILYEPDVVRPPSASEPQAFRLPQFDSYISDLAAFRVLPYVTMDQGRKKNISDMLVTTISDGAQRFRRFRQSDRNNDRVQSIPFGAYRWRRGGRN